MSQFLRNSFLLILMLLTASAVRAQYLHTDGAKIVDGSGNEVIWRGIGLGGWMLQEGYMLRTSGPQHEIEAKIEELVGKAKMDEFYEAWLANHTRKIDVDSLASWGYNMIRLPMHYKLFTPPIEEEPVEGEITWLDKGFEMTDDLLEWCKANNMYLILDLHAAPGGQGENADISDYDSSKPSLWESEANQDKMVALWRKLAERYAEEPMLAAYDIINEPNWGFQDHENDLNGCAESANTELWALQKRVTEAIREVDQNHIVVIEGNCWGNNYSGLPELWDDNLVMSYHKYWNPNTQNAIQGMLNMRTSRNVPIWLGETGENSNTWFTNAVALLEENGIGWAWWPLKKLGSNNPLQIKVNPGYQKILDFWGGNGVKPDVDEAFEGLMGLAENLKLENNIYHQDVVDAKIRQPHTDETIPFADHQVKVGEMSVVHATDYDLGKSEFAYSDTEVANTTGNAGGQAWNLGYAYRNDGVDIQATEDESDLSNGFNVGWTEDGEWMKYTVQVDSTGAYDFTLRYAGEGTAHLEVDGVDVTGPISLVATGGYQEWQDHVIADVPLYSGKRQLKLVIDKGGFNLSYLGFFLTKKLTDLPFRAIAASTDAEGLVHLSLNKKLNSESVSAEGFKLHVNETEVGISSAQPSGEFQISLQPTESLFDTDEIFLSYEGGTVAAVDQVELQSFESLEVGNNLPYHTSIPGKIEAEDFAVNNGLELEETTDTGGGQNIGYTSTGDYLDYNVRVAEAGEYTVKVRIACDSNPGEIQFQQLNSDGGVINSATVEVPVTGGWQTWQTVSATMTLDQARGVLRMRIADPEFNLNWFEFVKKPDIITQTPRQGMMLYPNPAQGYIHIALKNDEVAHLKLIGMDGSSLMDVSVVNGQQLDISAIPAGLYIAELESSGNVFRSRLLIQQ